MMIPFYLPPTARRVVEALQREGFQSLDIDPDDIENWFVDDEPFQTWEIFLEFKDLYDLIDKKAEALVSEVYVVYTPTLDCWVYKASWDEDSHMRDEKYWREWVNFIIKEARNQTHEGQLSLPLGTEP